jgi:hypothetical protein
MRQPQRSNPEIAPKIEEQKNPCEQTERWNGKNQYTVLERDPSLRSGRSSILIAHRATLRGSLGEGKSETASRSREV